MPGKDRDEESGRYTDTYADGDFLNAIQDEDGMAGTSDVAELVGCTRRTAYNRLRELESNGKVRSREVGNSLVWMVLDDE